MQEELKILIQAQYPLIYLVTSEEERAERTIAEIGHSKNQPKKVFVWTMTSGMIEYEGAKTGSQNNSNTISSEAAIQWVIRQTEPGIYIFKDLHPFLDAPGTVRWLRDAVSALKGTQKNYYYHVTGAKNTR